MIRLTSRENPALINTLPDNCPGIPNVDRRGQHSPSTGLFAESRSCRKHPCDPYLAYQLVLVDKQIRKGILPMIIRVDGSD